MEKNKKLNMPIKTLDELMAKNGSFKKINEDVTGDEGVYNSPIAELFGILFQSRDTAHIIHLSTKSYEVHIATNGYYDGIIDLIDNLIESYQGMYGILNIKIPSSSIVDPVSYFQNILSYVQNARKLFRDTNLQNKIDEIIDLLASTLYKLRFLQ